MSRPNVELVIDALSRFGTTGEPPWDAIREDVEVRDHDMMDAGDYHGHAGFARWIADWSAARSDESTEPEEFIEAGDRVVVFVRQRTTVHGSGVSLEREDAMVFALSDGQIVRLDYFNSREQALRAVGLSE